jgi:outer membrane receptor protein involved in Fe transport
MWRGRYIASTLDGAAPALPVTPVKGARVKAITYQDLQLERAFETVRANVTVGVNNIFDKSPPLSYANAPINFDIYTYDVMGRYYYLRFGKSF